VVILSVGAVWKSDYELYAHSAAARKAGISENAIRTLTAGGLPDDLSEQEKVTQRYAREFSARHRVDADLYSAAVNAFGEKGIVDLTYLIGIYHITCGLLNSFDIPRPD
jgi:4-carboxymuconolactone decarboxylase